jgi:hypothetical protein
MKVRILIWAVLPILLSVRSGFCYPWPLDSVASEENNTTQKVSGLISDRRPLANPNRFHGGVDLNLPPGSDPRGGDFDIGTPVVAVVGGGVGTTVDQGGDEESISITASDGKIFRYTHIDVDDGEEDEETIVNLTITAGTRIGQLKDLDNYPAHLHFVEISSSGYYLNPLGIGGLNGFSDIGSPRLLLARDSNTPGEIEFVRDRATTILDSDNLYGHVDIRLPASDMFEFRGHHT